MKAKALILELRKKDLMRLLEPRSVWVAILDHMRGRMVFVKRTEQALFQEMADHIRNWWADMGHEGHPPAANEAAVREYLDLAHDEKLTIQEVPAGQITGNSVYLGIISHARDHQIFAGTTREIVQHKVAEYIRSDWNHQDGPPPYSERLLTQQYLSGRLGADLVIRNHYL